MSDKVKATFELGYDSYVENLETKEKADRLCGGRSKEYLCHEIDLFSEFSDMSCTNVF